MPRMPIIEAQRIKAVGVGLLNMLINYCDQREREKIDLQWPIQMEAPNLIDQQVSEIPTLARRCKTK